MPVPEYNFDVKDADIFYVQILELVSCHSNTNKAVVLGEDMDHQECHTHQKLKPLTDPTGSSPSD